MIGHCFGGYCVCSVTGLSSPLICYAPEPPVDVFWWWCSVCCSSIVHLLSHIPITWIYLQPWWACAFCLEVMSSLHLGFPRLLQTCAKLRHCNLPTHPPLWDDIYVCETYRGRTTILPPGGSIMCSQPVWGWCGGCIHHLLIRQWRNSYLEGEKNITCPSHYPLLLLLACIVVGKNRPQC